ncbi:hypothetical protein AB0E69_40510 [Kribbella sp. NPDC026611]|uniref:hypothetical protein n=1 Tax=Kribbella sp. NPDC026611 TaxID=3154911 RepID=UPI0033F21B2F
MSKLEAVVAATSVESGRFHQVETTVDLGSLLRLFDQLMGIGQGYLELRSAEREFPLVTVGFRGRFAVMHCASAPDQMALLRGDGSVEPGQIVEVPIMGEFATFTGEFVLDTARARTALEDFVANGNPARLGEWCEL